MTDRVKAMTHYPTQLLSSGAETGFQKGGRGPDNCLLSTSIIMAHILLQQCSQYIGLHPAVEQFAVL